MLRNVKITRNQILFVAGLLGVVHQTVIENTDRLVLLGLFAAMMGLPLFLPGPKSEDTKPPDPPIPPTPGRVEPELEVEEP